MEFFLLFLLSTNKNRQPIGCLFLLVESIFFYYCPLNIKFSILTH